MDETRINLKLLLVAKCALADLEGIMPEFESSGDRKHPAWKTLKDLRTAIAAVEKSQMKDDTRNGSSGNN